MAMFVVELIMKTIAVAYVILRFSWRTELGSGHASYRWVQRMIRFAGLLGTGYALYQIWKPLWQPELRPENLQSWTFIPEDYIVSMVVILSPSLVLGLISYFWVREYSVHSRMDTATTLFLASVLFVTLGWVIHPLVAVVVIIILVHYTFYILITQNW